MTETIPIGDKRLLSRDDLVALGILFSRAHLHRLVQAGKFPAPVALGPQASARKAWRVEDVEKWLVGLPYAGSNKSAA